MEQPTLKIIVLDDDPTFCYLIKREFHKFETKVVVCAEVGDFAERLKTSDYDLAVVDYSLDGLTGLQVAQSLPGIKVLLISRTANWVERRRDCWSKNVIGFLHKKYGPRVMTSEIIRHGRIAKREQEAA